MSVRAIKQTRHKIRLCMERNNQKLLSLLCKPVKHLPDSPYVFLTFDDGPDPKFTPAISELLHSRGHKATFFFIGSNALKHKSIVRDVYQAGHSIGSHSSIHLKQWANSSSAVLEDYRVGHDQVQDVLGTTTSLFRPPYGHYDMSGVRFARASSTKVILWSCNSFDWEVCADLNYILEATRSRLVAGEILLFHDAIYDNPKVRDRTHTVEATAETLNSIDQLLLKTGSFLQ